MPEELKPVNLPGRPRNIVPLDDSGPAQLTGSIAYRQSKNTLESLFASVPVDKRPKQSTVYQSEVNDLLTGRYNNVIYGANNEDIHGRNQGFLDKAVNGTLKGVGLAATTFVGGLGTIYGIGKSFYTGKLSDVWKNEISESLDEINKEIDNRYLPNYYSDNEKNAAWYSSDNLLTTNFLFDKLIKNAGFAVGAIYSGNLAAKGIGVAGSAVGGMFDKLGKYTEAWKSFSDISKGASRLFSQGKNIEAAEILRKEISTIADVEKASSEMLKASNQFLAIEGAQDFTRKSIMALYSSAGESSFESIGTATSFRDKKIQEFKDKWGFDPSGEELEKINQLSKDVGNASFMANMAVLSATEFTQLPYLLGSSYKTGKATANAFRTAGEVVSEGGKYAAKSLSKLSKTKRFITSYIFDPKESLQEFLQSTIDVGVQEYYNKAYEGTEAKDLTEAFINAGTATLTALKETLTSKEGIESALLGGISGGLMQIKGKSQERSYKAKNTNSFLQELNVPESTFSNAFNDRVNSLQRGIALQQKGTKTLEDGDKLEFLDNKYDQIHNYLSTRIKYGRTDMVLDDIAERRKSSMNDSDYKKLQANGDAPMNLSREDYNKKLNEFETYTKNLTSLYASTNLIYQGKVNGDNERIYSDAVIDKMVYAASKITDYDKRIPQLNNSLIEAGVTNTQAILESIIKDNKPNKQATVDALNQINELDVIKEVKNELKENLSHIIELGLRRKLFIEQHNDIVENPSRYESVSEFKFGETEEVPVTVAQKDEEKPEKKLEIGKEYSLTELFRKEGTQLQLAPKITILSQTLGGEIEVRLPSGKTSFMTPEEFKKYEISDDNNTSQEMADTLDKAINTVLKDEKYSDLRKELTEASKDLGDKKIDKVGWINSLDNQELVDDIEREFNAQTKDMFEKKEKQRKEAEQLKRNKEEITKQQSEIVKDSGDVGTNDPSKDIVPGESSLKDAKKLFISGITESEGSDDPRWIKDPTQSALHIRISREFLNNVGGFKNRKNLRAILVTPLTEEAYGLKGLTQMSYGVSDEVASSQQFKKDIVNNDTGFVAQVFVEQVGDNLFFVDKDGNQIGEFGKQTDLSKVVFQTMPTTKLTDSQGTPRYRKDQKEEAEAYAAAWAKDRARIFATNPDSSPTIYEFQVSRGVGVITSGATNHISGILIDKNNESKILATDQTLIQIPTTGVIAHKSGQIRMPNGRPILVHNDNVQFLNNIKLTGKRALAVYEAINQIATEINEQSKAGKRIIINKKLARFLQNVLYWRLGKTSAETNQINIAEDGSSISFAGKTYAIPEISERRDELIEDIEKAFHNVNNKSFSPEMFSKPFLEYYIDKDGKLSEEPREWTNYQTYLLSSKYPDGSARPIEDTPLSTNVNKPTEEIPYTHKQKYATLIGLELPVGVIAKKEKKAEPKPTEKKEQKYDYDGDTENIYQSPFGDLIFTVKKGEDPIFDEEDDTFINTRANVIKAINAQRVKAGQPELSEEELIPQANGTIEALVKQELAKDVEAPAPTPKATAEQTITTKFGDLIFSIDEDGDPVIDQDNASNKSTIKNVTDAVAKMKPELSKDELSKTVDSTLSAIIKSESSKKPEAPAVQPTAPAVTTPVSNLKREDFPEEQSKVNTPVTQKLVDYLASVLGVEKIYITSQPYISWIKEQTFAAQGNKGSENLAQLELALNNPRQVFDRITKYKEAQQTAPVSTDAEADIERRRQEELNKKSTQGTLKNSPLDDITYYENKVAEAKKRLDEITAKEGEFVPGSDRELGSFQGMLNKAKKRVEDINAKYDAELAALEGGKLTEEPKTPGSFNVKNIKKRGNMGFRKVGAVDKTARMSEADFKAFKEWHAENVPTIPFEVLENMININDTEKAWGVFENGVAKFVKGGLRGTEYHEIGEAIWNGMLSPEEQDAILADERKRSGQFTDRETGKKYNYDDPTVSDNMMKERILDDFSDYRLGKLPARTLRERVRRFFKIIMDFFKSFVVKPSLKEKLFKAIDKGKFKDKELSTESKSMPPQYRAAGHLTEEQTNAYVKDMTGIAAAIILGNGKIGTIDKSAIYNLRTLTSDDVFNKVEEIYEEQGVREELGDVTWKDLVVKTKQELRTLLKIDFNEEDLININESETNKNDYAREPFSVDWKKNAPVGIKFVSATLLDREPTNQENSNSFKLPDPKINPKTQTYSLVPYTRVFSTMLEKLKNTTSIRKVVDKIVDLANKDANYVSMFQRVGGNLDSKTVEFRDFKTFEDWRLFIEMMQTYTKQKPNAVVQYISQGQVYSGSAMVTGIVNVTTRGWIQSMRNLAKDPDSVISYDSDTKTYSITDLSTIPTDTPQQKVSFLSELGITFPLEAFNKLKEEQQKEFTLAVASLKTYLQEAKEIMNIQKKTLDVSGQYNTLAELLVSVTHPNMETTRINIDGRQTNSFADNNAPSVFENEFNEAKTLDELLKTRPELQDVYSRGSQLLKKGGMFFDKEENRTALELKVGYIEGTKNKDDNRGTTTAKLSLGARFTQELNQNLLGQYYILVPADSSTEWMMNLGNHVSFEDIEQGTDGWKQINKIFRGYLTDDIALALDADNRKQLRNVGDKAKDLRFFKDILSDKDLQNINQMIADDSTQQDIETYVNDNIDRINESIKNYILGTVAETRDVLQQNNQIKFTGVDKESQIEYYKYEMLNDTFSKNEKLNKNKLTNDDVQNILTFANANYIINNIELHKILFGDPYQFAIKGKGALDETKRIKSFLSPRRTTIDSPELNTFLNEEMNKAAEIELQPGEPGYHEYKSWMDTVTVSDVKVMGSVANMKNVSKEIKKAFANTNEGDAASIMMDGTYRELKMKNGQWNHKGPEEAWHQWQMAYTRQNLPGFKYSDDARGRALEAHDIKLLKKKEPKHVIEVIKPIVSGSKSGSGNINLVLDKFSQMPLYYSMVKGTNLENLYLKMFKENKGYIIMISGRKVGAEALHDLYMKDGSFNEAAFNNNIEVPWKAYGIQVETTYEGSGEQTRGSQLTKIATLDLYDNGEPIGDTPERKEIIAKEVKRNKETLDKLHKNGYERFLKRLGIEDLGGSYKIVDKRALAKTLQDEMFRRELSDNVKDSIQLDQNGEFIIPFEASPAYLQIKSILYSFIDKEITSPKMHGGSYVQTPVTLWENAKEGRKIAIKTEDGYKQITRQEYEGYSEEQKKKVVLTSDTLKFYEDEDGKRHCEILLPHWFKSKLGKHAKKSDKELLDFLNNTKEGRELLTGIGFRIPTQALSSAEVFKVKGFLPQYMGKTVVVPSEITTKTGSDFDIDKLNMYLKSIYIDEYGEIKIARLRDTEESTKGFYANLFDKKLESKKISKAELFDAATILVEGLDDPKNLLDKYEDVLDEIFAEAYTLDERRDVLDDFMKDLEKLGDASVQAILKEKFVENMYRRSLENEYYDSLEKLLTLPENFKRLISPVSDDGLKEISDDLDKLRGYDENKIKNRLLNRNFMTSIRHAFITGKRWIGIAAVNITGHSLTQKIKAYIDPARFNNVSIADRKILRYGNGEVLLDHNKLEKDGKSYISLSGRLDAAGEFISDGLSGYATSFVDVALDPYILKIIKSDLVVGTFMFLRRIGVPKRQTVMFLNQPIIDEYLRMLDNRGIKKLFDSRYISEIQNKFPSSVTQEYLDGFNKSELEDNIKNYYATKDLGDYKNHEQNNIFQEFLKYAKMAEYSFKFSQASNYDTTKFQSGDSLQLKQWRTETAQNENIISSVGELLESNFIGVQAEYLDKGMDAMGEALVLETPEFTNITNEVLKPYEKDVLLSKDKFDKIANKIKAAFLDYIIQKRSDVADNLQKQLVDDKESVAQMLVKAKKEFPGVQIIEDLEIDSSGRIGGAQTIKLKVNDKIAYNENMYAGMMRELRDDPRTNELYKGIVKLAILQGTYQSAISIKNIIPVEDYSSHITPILAGLRVDDEIRAFATSNEFQRNEWQDDDVVPVLMPTFRQNPQTQSEEAAGLPITYQGLYKIIGRGKNKRKVPGFFPTIEKLGVNSQKRHLLFVNNKYQGKVSNYDVIKVPRIVPVDKNDITKGYIDVASGKEVTNSTYADYAKRGDLSLKNFYGYQKVKYADGSPLIAYYDQEGNPVYVYKFINLHGDGQYATEYYGDGRPSVFKNGSQKNVKNIDGTIVSNEIPDQAIVDYYGGQAVPQVEADPITATIEKETENINLKQPAPGVENIPNSGLTVQQGNSFIDLLQPQIANQAYIENKAKTANMMFSFGLRWARNIPNETEKSEQAKNLGKPRPNKKAIKSKEGMTYGYYLTDQNNKALPSIKELQPIMDFIQSKLGIDMSNYDAMLGNIYDNNSFIHQHRDTTESVTAKNYPVIVINLGSDGHLEFDRDTSSTYATYQKSGQLDLTNGGIYAFGVNGESRFTFHHRIGSGLESANPLKPITLPNGQVLNNYRITLTFRRASDLEPGMPQTPNIVSKETIAPTQPEAKVKKKELFTPEKGIAQKSFRSKTLNFVDKIPTNKETIVAMSNNRQTGVISIDNSAMFQKFRDKAWTKPAKQLDGSFATPLSENEFGSMDEWFTFALIHEVKHDTIKKAEGETTGQYEDRINQAALADLRENYNIPAKTVSSEVKIDKDIQDIIYKSNLDTNEYEVIEINGKQRVIDKRFVPERVKKGFSKFYASTAIDGFFIEKYGKKVIIPGFEDINLMMAQDSNYIYELSTGLALPVYSTRLTQKEAKEDAEKLFREKDIRKVLAGAKNTDINDALLTKIAPEGLPPIDNTNQNNCP